MAAPGIHLLRCLTPLHNGSGQGLGDLDRPIVREKTTGYPYVQGKTIKGAALARAREPVRNVQSRTIADAFGAGAEKGGEGNQGIISAVEAQLLLFPVRSLAGTFVWTTTAFCLARFAFFLDLAALHSVKATVANVLQYDPAPGRAIGASSPETDEAWDSVTRLNGNGQHILESLALHSDARKTGRQAAGALTARLAEALFADDQYWLEFFKKRLLVLAARDFDHLVQSATVVEANIQIDATGVTHDGSLRFTEFLPAETVLYSFYHAAPLAFDDSRRNAAIDLYENSVEGTLQLGADESAGKGIVSVNRLS